MSKPRIELLIEVAKRCGDKQLTTIPSSSQQRQRTAGSGAIGRFAKANGLKLRAFGDTNTFR